MNTRAPRSMDTREEDTREMSWKPPELLPVPEPQPGWAFRWMRVSTLGELDTLNQNAYRREGWEVVKPSECPEVAFGLPPDADRIEIGGLVLVKIDERIMKSRAKYFAEQAGRQMEAVDNQLMSENDPRMPIFRERSSKTSRSPRG